MNRARSRPAGSIVLIGLALAVLPLAAQTDESTYVWPKDPAVLAGLEKWQADKFGLLVHMGLYSELGTIESWGLCPEDWVTRPGFDDYFQYAAHYRGTKARFNPVNFDPDKWARGFKSSGAKYAIYSTKHHDGFCLYDTRYTDFKVTDPGCPFSSDPRSNVYKEVLNACRKEGLAVGAYFSKPDWTSPDFWWPYYPPKDRNPTYDITKHPERWRRFVEYTQNQIAEITTEYGKIDILWLDGCWVMPLAAVTLAVPWESCITMGNAWGWVPGDRYKSSRELIHLLVKIVAKGGNLLLGVGPNGKGEFEPAVFERFEAMGRWLRTNGEAIYGTHPVEPYQEGRTAYTAKDGKTVYAIYLTPEQREDRLRDLPHRSG